MPGRDELPWPAFYQGYILNFAHRGARELAPENTLPALRALRQAAPELLLGYLYSHLPATPVQGWLAGLAVGRDTALHPRFPMVDGPYMQRARRQGQHVNV